ncbi:helix-turn-helix transcriptional regulator [Lachnospiraceae bacterium MD329]|nr:helix-turn-helix transcriptional regulator [Lachnospiraceae bacterium MD329]
MIDYKKAGQRIQTQRKILGLTQEVVSEKVGITPSFFSLIESGTRKAGIKTFVSISKTLGISLDYIFDIETDKSLIKDFDSFEYQIINNLKNISENHKNLVLDLVISIQKNL